MIKIWQPGVVLPLVLLAVVIAALNRPETGRALRAGLRVANFVSTPLSYAEVSPVRRLRMIAFPLDDRDTRTAGPRALAPRAPFAPTAVDLPRPVHDRHALLVLTPLGQLMLVLLSKLSSGSDDSVLRYNGVCALFVGNY